MRGTNSALNDVAYSSLRLQPVDICHDSGCSSRGEIGPKPNSGLLPGRTSFRLAMLLSGWPTLKKLPSGLRMPFGLVAAKTGPKPVGLASATPNKMFELVYPMSV